MAQTIKIKRSTASAAPTTIAAGELAYSKGSQTLYIGDPDTNNANTPLAIGPAIINNAGTVSRATGVTATELQQIMDTEVGVDVQAYDAGLTDIASLAVTNGNFIVGDGTNWVAESGATARTSLGLGSLATLNSVGAAQITDNSVGAAELNVSGNGTAGQALVSDGDGTMSWSTISVTDNDVNVANLTARLPQITENVTIGDATDVTVTTSGDLSVTGNLTVNGTTTTVNSTTVTVDDPVFTLGGDTAPASDDNKDRGIEFRWHNGTAAKVGFFGFDDSTGKFTFIPDATNASEVFSGTAGTVVANLEGGITTTGGTSSGNLDFADGAYARFGTGNDLSIGHTGTISVIEDGGTGGLFVETNGPNISLRGGAGNTNMAIFTSNGSSALYNNNNLKLETADDGIDVTGTVNSSDDTVGLLMDSDHTGTARSTGTTGIYVERGDSPNAYVYYNHATGLWNHGVGSGVKTMGTITGVTGGTGINPDTEDTTGNVTLSLDLSELTDMTAAMVGTDEFIVLDAGADRRKAANEINLSIFNNDSGFTSNVGDITSVQVSSTDGSISGTGTGTTGAVSFDLEVATIDGGTY